ncbi:hypothetical protein D3C86_1975410 [compost metagenome]
MIAVPVDDECEYQRRETDCLNDSYQGVITEITHYGSVHTETYEKGNSDYRSTEKQPEVNPQGIDHFVDPKADDKRQPQGYPNENDVR